MARLPDMFLKGAEDAGGRVFLPTTGLCVQQGPAFIVVVVPGPYAPKPFQIVFLISRADRIRCIGLYRSWCAEGSS